MIKIEFQKFLSGYMLKKFTIGLLFTAIFIAADMLSYIEPIGQLNITPWNPPAAIEVLFLYWGGIIWTIWVYVTLCLSDEVVRNTPLLTPASFIGNAVLVVCYATIAEMLRFFLRKNLRANDRMQLLKLGLVLVGGAAITSIMYVSIQTYLESLPMVEFGRAIHRFFVGDLLGFMVVLPLAFVVTDERRFVQFKVMLSSTFFWILMALIVVCMYLIDSMPSESLMKYFFLFFFLAGLAAATYSLPGATFAAALIQVLLVYSTHDMGNEWSLLMDMQMVMLALALTALIIGWVVDERMHAEQRLRDGFQLVAAGELAGSLAHELHQPLSALSAYAESAKMLIEQADSTPHHLSTVNEVMQKIVNETIRAKDIVKGLRAYFTGGASHLQQTSISDLIDDCLSRHKDQFESLKIGLVKRIGHQTDTVMIDAVQIGTALSNLLKNALEASTQGMTVTVETQETSPQWLSIRVQDQGKLLNADVVDHIFRPLFTQKKNGLGLGLSISKSLIENNGGYLQYLSTPVKSFEILLPIDKQHK